MSDSKKELYSDLDKLFEARKKIALNSNDNNEDTKTSINYIIRRIISVSDKKIVIKNKIKDRLEEFCEQTGASKVWIAKQLGFSKSALSQIFKSTNPTIETLIKFSLLLDCNISDLYEYEIVDLDEY
jgi:DNA-binding XRE family transcriptional regulator